MADTVLQIDDYNDDLSAWAKSTRQKLISKLAGYPLHTQLQYLKASRVAAGRDPLNKSIKSRLLKDAGEINAIRFTFPRHGIFFERGYAGSRRTTPRPWIAPVLDAEVNNLEKIIVEKYSGSIVARIRVLVPGVFEKTIDLG